MSEQRYQVGFRLPNVRKGIEVWWPEGEPEVCGEADARQRFDYLRAVGRHGAKVDGAIVDYVLVVEAETGVLMLGAKPQDPEEAIVGCWGKRPDFEVDAPRSVN